jgi:hypothetical protein
MSNRADRAKDFFKKIESAGEEGVLETAGPESMPSFEHLELPKNDLDLTQRTYEKIKVGDQLSDSEQFALEAIIIPDKRPAIEIIRATTAFPIQTG